MKAHCRMAVEKCGWLKCCAYIQLNGKLGNVHGEKGFSRNVITLRWGRMLSMLTQLMKILERRDRIFIPVLLDFQFSQQQNFDR